MMGKVMLALLLLRFDSL